MFRRESVGERSGDDTGHDSNKRPVRIILLSGLGAVAMVLGGCGDSSSSSISKCPSPEYYLDHSPVKPRPFMRALQDGVHTLRMRIRSDGDAQERDVAVSDIDSRYRAAAEDVFRTDDEASDVAGEEVLVLGTDKTDNNVDEPGEAVCSGNGGEFFPTEGAETAAADMENAGIGVFQRLSP